MKIIYSFLLIAAMFGCQPETATTTISGRVYFAGDSTKAVKNTIVQALGAQSYQTSVSADGSWEIDVEPGQYVVIPYKRTDTLNGIDLADRTLIQGHLTALTPLNQWQKFAADVNKSEMMTTYDAFLIGAAILNTNPDARGIIGGWWTFCPADYVAPQTDGFFVPIYPTSKTVDVQADVQGIDFVGFRRGDPNLNSNPEQ